MTPKERAAMRQALDALCNAVKPKHGFYYSLTEVPIDCAYKYQNAITALREALAEQAEQEPVAEVRVRPLRGNESVPKIDVEWLTRPTAGFLYTAPVRTKDLTDDEIVELWRECDGMSVEDYARAVIAADREKNCG